MIGTAGRIAWGDPPSSLRGDLDSMSSRTYVCFDCRTTERVPTQRITRDCRKCHKPSEHVFFKLRIPRRGDDRGWDELRVAARKINDGIKWHALAFLREKAETYERELVSSPAHAGSSKKRHLRELRERIAQWERWR